MGIKKVFFRRGPDGLMHEFHSTGPDDEWQPAVHQQVAIVDALHGAGWVRVAAVRPIYTGSLAHTEMAKLFAGDPNQVYLKEMQVYCEEVDFQELDEIALAAIERDNKTSK